jgi:hypothetical protein
MRAVQQQPAFQQCAKNRIAAQFAAGKVVGEESRASVGPARVVD